MTWMMIITLTAYYALHSLLADSRVKTRLQEQWIAQRWYRLWYNAVAVVTLLPVMWCYKQADHNLLFASAWWTITPAIAGMAAGMILFYFALKQYDLLAFTGIAQWRQSSEAANEPLVTNGLHRWMRHPLYSAGLLEIWSWFLYHPSVAFGAAAIITTTYLIAGTRLEEQKLVATYGEPYRQYQQQVPMLIPLIWRRPLKGNMEEKKD